MAPDFTMLAMARAVSGMAAAAFVPNAITVAGALTSPAQRGRAVSLVLGGFTLALVLGAPAGTWIGFQVGWRLTLAALGVAAVAAAVALKLRLPGGIMLPGATLSTMRAVLANRALRVTIGLNLLAAIGTFVLFSYAASAWPVLLRADAAVVAPALALFGIGSLVGNGVSAWAVDRFAATRTATLALTAAAVAMAVLALGALPVASWAALAGCGMANFIATTALQTRLVGALPALVPAALPLDASATFAGQAFGAFMGSLWLAHGTHVSDAQHRPEAVGLAWIACLTLALDAITASMLPSMVAGPEKSGGTRGASVGRRVFRR